MLVSHEQSSVLSTSFVFANSCLSLVALKAITLNENQLAKKVKNGEVTVIFSFCCPVPMQ